MNTDEVFMRRAVDLALRARGRTSPNPVVGAVIVRDGRVLGEGYHRRAGLPHAEIEALRKAPSRSAGPPFTSTWNRARITAGHPPVHRR